MSYIINDSNGATVRVDDGKEIANFHVKLAGVKEYTKNDKVVRKTYILNFFNTEYMAEAEVDAKALDKFDYSSVDDMLLLSPTVSTAGKEVAYHIKSQSKGIIPTRVYLFDKLGWHKVNNHPCYCAGDMVIGSPDMAYEVSRELSEKFRFEYDPEMSEIESINHAFKFMNAEPRVTGIVFVTGMLGVLRQIFADADIKIPCILYVFGPSQTRKTTTINFGTAFYGRGSLQNLSGISTLRVSSSEFKSEECVDTLKDATFVFDDLYKEPDKKLRKEYEKRFRNIIRNFADNSQRTTVRSAFENNCQVIMTAEYLLESKTDIGRLFLLNVETPIDSKKLAQCQEQPLSISTFYYYFIKWVCERYDSIVNDVTENFKAFRIYGVEHKFGYERLYEQSLLLNYAFELFLRYATERGYNISNKKLVENQFCGFVNEALAKQKTTLETLEKREVTSINFSRELLEMVNNKIITVGKKDSDCFIQDNCLYITIRTFAAPLRDKFGRTFSSKEIAKYFRDRYIAESYSDNRLKKHNNKSCLILHLNELLKDAKDDSYTLNNLFYE